MEDLAADGNTARRAFQDSHIFSEISGINAHLIANLKTILICLSCQVAIHLKKFEAFCFKTAELIIDKYPWLPMTATVHKILIHGSDINQNTIHPVGYFGEDARNKFYESDRLHHARKCNRTQNFTDVCNWAMGSSDPIISSLNLDRGIQRQKKMCIPSDVLQLLECSIKTDEM